MNREGLVAAGYHISETQRHHDAYLRALDSPTSAIDGVEGVSFTDRFTQLLERIEPLLKPQDVYDRDWYLTPEVPLSGEVEGKDFTVFLSIQVQKGRGDYRMITPFIRTSFNNDTPGGMRGLHVSLDSCARWQNSGRKEEPLEELDHVEEAVDVYLRAVAILSSKELHELGFPSDYIPEDIQLTLEDALTAE